MRIERLCCLPLLVCLAACGGDGPAPVAKDSPQTGQEAFLRAIAERSDDAPPAAAGVRLKQALPGGVLPDFDHALGADVSSRQVHATRIVSLRVRGVDAREALDALARAFTAAGFEAGTVASHRDTLLQEFWTPGPARGLVAVSAGGNHIAVMARDFAPDSDSAKEGFPTMVMVTVNSP